MALCDPVESFPRYLDMTLVGGLVGLDGERDGMFHWFDWVMCSCCLER